MAKYAVGALVTHKSSDIKGVIDGVTEQVTGLRGIGSNGMTEHLNRMLNTNYGLPL